MRQADDTIEPKGTTTTFYGVDCPEKCVHGIVIRVAIRQGGELRVGALDQFCAFFEVSCA
jgi:hypothetical protein